MLCRRQAALRIAARRLLSTRAEVYYQSSVVPTSLSTTGSVGTNRDLQGSDSEFFGVDPLPTLVDVANGRECGDFSLHTSGFKLATSSAPEIDYFDNAALLNVYYGACEALVAQETGASRVLAFDHNLRARARKATADRLAGGGNAIQEPLIAYGVHNDYSAASARRRIEQLAKPLGANDTLRARENAPPPIQPSQLERLLSGRWMFVNVWRNVARHPVERHPLAMCDAATVSAEDLVTFEIRYADRIGENYLARHSEAHRWYYFPRMTRDEAAIIKCWDSHGRDFAPASVPAADTAPATFSLHTGFDDPATPEGAPDRESVEVRCVAFFETPSSTE